MDPINPEVKKEDDVENEASPSGIIPGTSLCSQYGILTSIKEESEGRENDQFMDEVKEEIDIKIEEEEVPLPDDPLMLCSQERPSLEEGRGEKRTSTENDTQKIIDTCKADCESHSAKRFKDLKEAREESSNSGDKTVTSKALNEEGNMEQHVLPCHSATLVTVTESSLPSSSQPGPSQQSHHLPSSQPEVQPTSLHTLPVKPSSSMSLQSLPQATMPAANSSKCEASLSTSSPPQSASLSASRSRDVTPLPSSSSPKAAVPAGGPIWRHKRKLDRVTISQMVEIQHGILTETRNIRASLDKIGDQLKVLNSTFSSHINVPAVLDVIANSIVKIASKKN